MQIFKAICVAGLCVVAIAQAHPMDDHSNNDNSTGAKPPKLEWWENAVFYQIYPRSFRDSNGDGIGDIRGIIEKLDYLQELGIEGAWLSPIFKSPMIDFGYDISDFCDIEPIFGTVADVEELFKEAAKRNLKIILDFVPNHTSDKHKWFIASADPTHPEHEKYRDYYIWSDGKDSSPPNNWVSTFYGPAWTFHKQRQQWYYHNFVKEQPDLNYRNSAVVNEMINIFNFWLKKGASGFRIDAVNHMFECEDLRDEPLSGTTNDPKAYEYTLKYCTADQPEMYEMVYKFRKAADQFQEKYGGERRILMTEAYTNTTEYVKYFKSADGSKLGSQMPFNFILIKDLDRHSSVAEFKSIIDDKINSVPSEFHLNWVIGNHDRPRVGSRYGERRIGGLLTLIMTLPGIAITYNGEEIGMLDHRTISYGDTLDPAACNLDVRGNWLEESRDPERTPFQWDATKFAGFMPENASEKPWLPIHPNAKELNVAEQKDQPRSTLNFYKHLLQLRKDDTFAYGSYESNVLNDNVFAYVRALNKSATYVVLINFGEREEKIDMNIWLNNLPDELELAAVGTDSCYVHGKNVTAKEVVLRKYDTLILKAPHVHHTGAGSSVIANIALTFPVMFASIARFIF